MKALLFFSLQILLTSLIISQWTYEATLPYQQRPLVLQICVIDSSVSWAFGNTNRSPNPYFPYFAIRTKTGWKQVTNTDLALTTKAKIFTARDSSIAWLGTFYPEAIYYTSNGGVNWILQYYISDTVLYPIL